MHMINRLYLGGAHVHNLGASLRASALRVTSIGIALLAPSVGSSQEAAAPSSATTELSEPAGAEAQKSERHRGRRERAAEPSTLATNPAGEATADDAPGLPRGVTLDPEGRHCRTMKVLGTRVSKKVCATASEWAAFESKSKEAADEGLRRAQGRAVPPPETPPGQP
jgi:hypothetical protein